MWMVPERTHAATAPLPDRPGAGHCRLGPCARADGGAAGAAGSGHCGRHRCWRDQHPSAQRHHRSFGHRWSWRDPAGGHHGMGDRLLPLPRPSLAALHPTAASGDTGLPAGGNPGGSGLRPRMACLRICVGGGGAQPGQLSLRVPAHDGQLFPPGPAATGGLPHPGPGTLGQLFAGRAAPDPARHWRGHCPQRHGGGQRVGGRGVAGHPHPVLRHPPALAGTGQSRQRRPDGPGHLDRGGRLDRLGALAPPPQSPLVPGWSWSQHVVGVAFSGVASRCCPAGLRPSPCAEPGGAPAMDESALAGHG